MDSFRIVQAERLPKGVVQAVTPSLVHQGKVYAHDVTVALTADLVVHLDARRLPLDVTTLVGRYGEMVAYITEFAALHLEPIGTAQTLGRYLGHQISVVFFPALLTRYRLLEAGLGEQDAIPEFQDDYDRMSRAYHSLGFPVDPYEEVPLLHTDFGVFVLGATALEQLEAVATIGAQVYFSAQSLSLVSFKELPPPRS